MVVGERVKTKTGATTLQSSKKVIGRQKVYNLEVYQDHNFLVSLEGVLVHNLCDNDYLFSGKEIAEEGAVGTYKQGSGHLKGIKTSRKNPAPENGQKVLDNSILFKEKNNGQRRIGREGDNFVILDQEGAGMQYHGHIRTWDELEDEMQKFLIKEGVVNKKGKFK